MRRFIYLLTICMLIMITGCQKDIPEPETKMEVEPVTYTELSYDIPVSGFENNQIDPFYIKHQVKGKDVLIECIVKGISFRDQSQNKGKINIYVNGKKREEVMAAAFIVKGLPTGTHRIKLEVVQLNNSSEKLSKEFYVIIP